MFYNFKYLQMQHKLNQLPFKGDLRSRDGNDSTVGQPIEKKLGSLNGMVPTATWGNVKTEGSHKAGVVFFLAAKKSAMRGETSK